MLARPSTLFFGLLAVGIILLILMTVDAAISQRTDQAAQRQRRDIVRALALTDLCLFTESRYTRHPSMADLHSPFQDHPSALERFPSGALMRPPPHLVTQNRE